MPSGHDIVEFDGFFLRNSSRSQRWVGVVGTNTQTTFLAGLSLDFQILFTRDKADGIGARARNSTRTDVRKEVLLPDENASLTCLCRA